MCIYICNYDLSFTVPFQFSLMPLHQAYKNQLDSRTQLHLGYPYNLDFDFSALHGLQNYSINNLGDPWVESNYGVHSRQFEVY